MKKFILSFAVACFCLQSIGTEASSIEQANEAVASPKKSSKKEKAKKILKTTGKVLGYSIVVVLFVTISIGLVIFAGDTLFNDRKLLQQIPHPDLSTVINGVESAGKAIIPTVSDGLTSAGKATLSLVKKIPHPDLSTVINGAESAGRAIIPTVSDGLTSAGKATLSLVQNIPHPDLSTVINGAESAGKAIIPTVSDGLTSAGEMLASEAGELILSEVSNSEQNKTVSAFSSGIALTTNYPQEPTSNKQSRKNPATQTTNPTTSENTRQIQLSDTPLATIEIVDPNENTPDEDATKTLFEVNQFQPIIPTEVPFLEANYEDQAIVDQAQVGTTQTDPSAQEENPEDHALEINTATMIPQPTKPASSYI